MGIKYSSLYKPLIFNLAWVEKADSGVAYCREAFSQNFMIPNSF